MVLEPARSTDLDAIAKIEAEAYHPDLVTSLAGITQIHENLGPDGRLYVHRKDDAVVGFAHFGMNQPEAGVCTLFDVAVDKTARRTGVGRSLLEEVISVAACAGMQKVVLYVPEDNPAARDLYDDFGFENAGRIPGYYPPQSSRDQNFTIDALVMELKLPNC